MKQSADRLGWRKVHPERFAISAFTISALIAASAANAANSNPYNGIIDRNVFSLKPKVEEPTAPKEEPKPPVKLTLTGITTLFGNKRALLAAQIPAKPPEQAKNESYMLTEGQRDGGVEVVSIDEKAGKVVVNNNGIRETLDFVNNGARLASVVAPGHAVPPVKGINGLTGNSGYPPQAAHTKTPPVRSLRNGETLNENSSGTQNQSTATYSPTPSHAVMSAEEQVITIEAQREYFLQQGDSTATILPPTEMTPPGAIGSGVPELPQ